MKILNKDYSNALESKIAENATLYKKDKFEIGKENFYDYPPIANPPIDLLSQMVPTSEGDYQSAIALFEAFPNLTNMEAGDHAFWNTLSHTILFPYVKKRWPYNPQAKGNPSFEKHIENHWFYDSGLRKNALAHLWWCVKVSVLTDQTEMDKYELTKVLFDNYSFRVVFWGSSNFFRNTEATHGVLRWIKDNRELFNEAADRRGKFICVHLHKLGAVKQLCCMDSQFYYNELERIKDQIIDAPKRPDKHKTQEEKQEEEE